MQVTYHKNIPLTSCIFQTQYCLRRQSYTAEETCALSFMNFLLIPYANSDGVVFTHKSKIKKNSVKNTSILAIKLREERAVLYKSSSRFKCKHPKFKYISSEDAHDAASNPELLTSLTHNFAEIKQDFM